MRCRIPARLVLLLLCLPGLVRAAEGWAQLKIGLTAEETVAAIGQPLLRSAGRGFELWIYDERAEVIFFGSLIGWTAPGPNPNAALSKDVWSGPRTGLPTPTFLSQLPKPMIKTTPVLPPSRPGPTWLPAYGFRP